MRRSADLIAALVLMSGCLDGRYRCATSSQCSFEGVAGTCEATGFCSFPDPTCEPSGRRYGELADPGHRDRCVDDGPAACVRSLTSGGLHSCLVARDGTIWCWGANEAGQLGNGGFAASAVPVQVIDAQGRPFAEVDDIDAGLDFTCAHRTDGSLWCWGNGRRLGGGDLADQPHPRQVQTADGASLLAAHVSAGANHACAVGDDRGVWCWGNNDSGQLGGTPTVEQLAAAPVRLADTAPLDGAVLVAAGAQFTCAARSDNVWCWGSNMFVQLGQPGGPIASPTPVVALPATVTALATGGAHGCAVGDDRSVWCWGRAEDGQIGQPDLPGIGVAPVRVLSAPGGAPLAPVVSIATGESHSCAATADGRALCWGAGAAGQLGQDILRAETPVEVRTVAGEPLGDVVAVTAGIDDYNGAIGRHSCARQRDAVWCWGTGDKGVLGNGQSERSAAAVPVDLSRVCP